MADHGSASRARVCGTPIQRIKWPRTLDEMERWKSGSSS
jgi:hypothetical protein